MSSTATACEAGPSKPSKPSYTETPFGKAQHVTVQTFLDTYAPPLPPEVDLEKPGQVCPVVGAKTDHHHALQKHPKVPIPSDAGADASACPALKGVETTPQGKELDEKVCPVVGYVSLT